jgi:hypothetical protein
LFCCPDAGTSHIHYYFILYKSVSSLKESSTVIDICTWKMALHSRCSANRCVPNGLIWLPNHYC